VNLTDLFRDTLSPVEVFGLITKLPEGSRIAAAQLGGPEHVGWDHERHFLALLIDAINTNTYAFVAANSKKKPKEPQAIPRPGDAQRKKQAKENNPFTQMVNLQLKKLDTKEK
jgi:hypothetical protein